MAKRKWKPKYNPGYLEALLAEVSDHILTHEEGNNLVNINYDDDDVLCDVLRKHCKALFDGEPEDSRIVIRNALHEALTDPHYHYDEIWSNLVFPFAYPDGIQDPERFLGLLWRALFDEDSCKSVLH